MVCERACIAGQPGKPIIEVGAGSPPPELDDMGEATHEHGEFQFDVSA
jgi:hypothetical protein